MYECDIHGELDTDWCDKCSKLLQCDCSDLTVERFKDMLYSKHDYTVSIYIEFCETCGEIKSISSITDDNGNTHKLTKEGKSHIYSKDGINKLMEEGVFYGFDCDKKLYRLQSNGGVYLWHFSKDSKIMPDVIQQGNVFKTKIEAEKERAYRVAKFRLNTKMRELEGDWKADWDDTSQCKYFFSYNYKTGCVTMTNSYRSTRSLENWRYSKKEVIDWIVKTMADDIKTILGVEK